VQRTDRLFEILRQLRDNRLHRAEDLAAHFGVSVRTIYRDMDTLAASGVGVAGTRGEGYRLRDMVTLPPLSLSWEELEALNLGIAIAAQSADPELKAAATSLGDKVDAALPERNVPQSEGWKFATYPFADTARGIRHMPMLRAAIRARQKLRLTVTAPDGNVTARRVRPLLMESWGRVWTLTVWCETTGTFEVFRLDLIDSAEALPELFEDEPGRTLADYSG
jgi:predicted DNA-binding transcriptional regulator YafY